MTDAQRDHRVLHIIALVVALLTMLALFVLPPGIGGYLLLVGAGLVAVVIGHRAVRRPGALLWAAIVGLVLSYLELLVAAGLLIVRVTRILAG